MHFKYIAYSNLQRQNEKFYFIILVTSLQSIEGSSERAGKLEPNDFI